MKPIIQLKHIHKSYAIGTPVENEVLHDINLTLNAGSFSALTGPSGSGKSTLLNLIGLLEAPSKGQLIIQDQSIASLNDAQITELRGNSIGFIFQFHHLLPAFNALENVMMPSIIHHNLDQHQAICRAQALLAAVGLSAATQKKPAELSGGMQQRVAIARALMMQPSLVLADEPTGNLDTHSADEIFNLLQKINQELGIAFLIVTHDLSLARRCTQRFNLIDGRFDSETETI